MMSLGPIKLGAVATRLSVFLLASAAAIGVAELAQSEANASPTALPVSAARPADTSLRLDAALPADELPDHDADGGRMWQTVDNTKGDRRAVKEPIEESTVVTHVELVGGAARIILLDPDGNVVYSSDPATNTTVIARDVVIPSVTIREAEGAVAELRVVSAAAPVRTPSALIEALAEGTAPPADMFYRTDFLPLDGPEMAVAEGGPAAMGNTR